MTEEEKKAINRLKLLSKKLYSDNYILVNSNDLKISLNIINRLQKENEKYEYIHQQTIKDMIKLEKENVQLKKQIDLILNFLANFDLGYYKKEEGGEIVGKYQRYNKYDWEDHFEKLREKQFNIEKFINDKIEQRKREGGNIFPID